MKEVIGLHIEIDYAAIGVRIRRLRKAQELTQQNLAELAGLEPSNISHIERGATKLSLPTIVNIANALHVTVDDLLCDSLSAAERAYDKAAEELLADCNMRERKILTEAMFSLKETLRQVDGYPES